MPHNSKVANACAFAFFSILALVFLDATAQAGKGFSVLYTFCQQSGCADGSNPVAGLIADASGNLYGTTEVGGIIGGCPQFGGVGCGTVFKLAPDGTETVLYTFTGGSDGGNPGGGLVMDASGNLYGTTINGGTGNCQGPNSPPCGTVYKVTPTGVETVLYSFTGEGTGFDGTDGNGPLGNLVMDRKGNLYGTTSGGGNNFGNYGSSGTVFKVTPSGSETVLFTFCTDVNGSCGYGIMPKAGLILKSGYLYGTTSIGGDNGIEDYGNGTAFKISTSGTNFTVLYTFCPQGYTACNGDGARPEAPLVMDRSGNLYGTTFLGGTGGGHCYNAGGDHCGTVFEIGADGTETVLNSFCSANDYYCAVDGANPTAGVIAKTSNGSTVLYGTTSAMGYGSNGENGGGTVFSLSGGVETVLHYFCSENNCADGSGPDGSLIMKRGYLYGTTQFGGSANCYLGCGTVFKVGTLGGDAR